TEDVKQLGYGAGQVLQGEGILAITKAVLQSGVSYVGGYPGAPVSHLLDVMADANEPLLRPMGIYFEVSGSEASAAALLGASLNQPALFRIRIRADHMRGTMVCKDNVPPTVGMRSPLDHPVFTLDKINLPPFTYAMEAQKVEHRLPAAQRYIREHRLNEHHRGTEPSIGILMQGGLYNTTVRALGLLGAADLYGASPVPLLVLNAIHPLVPEELLEFLAGKRRVLVVEEGMPNYIEQQLKALAHDERLAVEIHGKDLFGQYGEYVPHLVLSGLPRVLTMAHLSA